MPGRRVFVGITGNKGELLQNLMKIASLCSCCTYAQACKYHRCANMQLSCTYTHIYTYLQSRRTKLYISANEQLFTCAYARFSFLWEHCIDVHICNNIAYTYMHATVLHKCAHVPFFSLLLSLAQMYTCTIRFTKLHICTNTSLGFAYMCRKTISIAYVFIWT